MAFETTTPSPRDEKRSAALKAAMTLFSRQGYEHTSLQQIGREAGLSTATLFKRFPTKAAIFETLVNEFWSADSFEATTPPPGNTVAGLTVLGSYYARRMRRPDMAALYRIIIAEVARFPGLGRLQAEKSKGPYLDRIAGFLAGEVKAGTLAVPDTRKAAEQFMGLIMSDVLTPGLLAPDFVATDAQVTAAVVEAVAMIVMRYSTE